MKKVVTAIDVDGTIIDSLNECFEKSKEAWEEVEGTSFPMDLESFRTNRWSVKVAEQYFQNAKLLANGVQLPQEFSELEGLRRKIDASSVVTKFYESRRKAAQNKEAWLNEHRLFEEVPEMFQELEKLGTVNTVVTTKDKESTLDLLEHFGIAGHIDAVYAREESKESADRKYQFGRILKDYQATPSDVIAYDDLPEQLEIAKSLGFSVIAAPQGYSRDKDLAKYIKARPLEFAAIVSSVIRGEKK
jgi:phosphoglycolate phosphatase-like HAD superfamily hydrolase